MAGSVALTAASSVTRSGAPPRALTRQRALLPISREVAAKTIYSPSLVQASPAISPPMCVTRRGSPASTKTTKTSPTIRSWVRTNATLFPSGENLGSLSDSNFVGVVRRVRLPVATDSRKRPSVASVESLFGNTRSLPSGDQSRLPGQDPNSAILRSGPPRVGTTNIPPLAPEQRIKAMRWPSADQTGQPANAPGDLVIRTGGAPSPINLTSTSYWPPSPPFHMKASWLPSGEKAGRPSMPELVARGTILIGGNADFDLLRGTHHPTSNAAPSRDNVTVPTSHLLLAGTRSDFESRCSCFKSMSRSLAV